MSGFLARAAYAGKNLFGSSSFRQKAIIAGAALGGTKLANTLIDIQQENRKAYYGEERYNAYYGDNVESAKTFISVFGMYTAATAIFGRDPISRGINSGKRWFGEGRRLRNIINKQRVDRPATRIAKGPMEGQVMAPLTRSRRANPGLVERYNKLKKAPQIGLLHGSLYTSMLATGAGTNTGPGAMILGGTLIAAAGLVGAKGAHMAGRMLLGHGVEIMPNLAATAVGAGVGYVAGSRNNNMTAEGTVTGFMDSNSVVSRMNFSTAGLTLALHRNNRKY